MPPRRGVEGEVIREAAKRSMISLTPVTIPRHWLNSGTTTRGVRFGSGPHGELGCQPVPEFISKLLHVLLWATTASTDLIHPVLVATSEIRDPIRTYSMTVARHSSPVARSVCS